MAQFVVSVARNRELAMTRLWADLAMTAIVSSVTEIQQLPIHRQRLADDNFFVKLT